VTRAIAGLLLAAAAVAAPAARTDLVEREAYLMGTRAWLGTYAPDRAKALSALDSALAVLERSEAELSTWRADSAISALNRVPLGVPWRASGDLCRMFETLYAWSDASGHAFDPAIGALTTAWGIHDRARVPERIEVTQALRQSGLDRLDFDRPSCTLTRRADVTIDVGGFGKGEALDRAAAALPSASWMIDLGGQIAVGGPRPGGDPWPIDIAHPLHRDRAFLRVFLWSGSLSTSGGSERDLLVAGQRVGHILDPRTGFPAAFAGSVTVWHERALVADVLSTALYVLGPEEGLRWADARDLSVCYLIPERGEVRVVASDAFRRLLAGPASRAALVSERG
jgi:thiamine biosynthesis lipoprotein